MAVRTAEITGARQLSAGCVFCRQAGTTSLVHTNKHGVVRRRILCLVTSEVQRSADISAAYHKKHLLGFPALCLSV